MAGENMKLDKLELPYFNIGNFYGGSQGWFNDFWMYLGGCGALTMCDLMIYMAMYRGRPECCPPDVSCLIDAGSEGCEITRNDYVRFGMEMKPFLRPRSMGIKDLDTFIGGAQDYLKSRNVDDIDMAGFDGREEYAAAEQALKSQIAGGMPVPMLMLNHKDRSFSFFEWHWFLLVGYEYRNEDGSDVLYAKAATYGSPHWLRFDKFWDTGEEERGGMIIVTEQENVVETTTGAR